MNALALSSSLVHEPFEAFCGSVGVLNDGSIAECEHVGSDVAALVGAGVLLLAADVGGFCSMLVEGMGVTIAAGAASASATLCAGAATMTVVATGVATAGSAVALGISSTVGPAALFGAMHAVITAPFAAVMLAMMEAMVDLILFFATCSLFATGAAFVAAVLLPILMMAASACGGWLASRWQQRQQPWAEVPAAVGVPINESPTPMGIPVAEVEMPAEDMSLPARLYPSPTPGADFETVTMGLPVC